MEVAELVSRHCTGIEDRLEMLYEPAFLRVAKYISKAGGSFEDARDIFHDSLVEYFEKRKKGMPIESDIHYITGIARHLWLARVKDQAKFSDIDRIEVTDQEAGAADEQKILRFLQSTGKRCLDLLVGFYYGQLSISKLAERFGFTSEHSASVQKYKCIEKLRETVKSKSLDYADFFE